MDLQREKDTFVATRQDFAQVEASAPQNPTDSRAEDKVKPFLQACMNMLRNQQAVENLQALLDGCVGKADLVAQVKDVHKLNEQKRRIVREM